MFSFFKLIKSIKPVRYTKQVTMIKTNLELMGSGNSFFLKSFMNTAFHFSAFKLRALCKKVLLNAFICLT